MINPCVLLHEQILSDVASKPPLTVSTSSVLDFLSPYLFWTGSNGDRHGYVWSSVIFCHYCVQPMTTPHHVLKRGLENCWVIFPGGSQVVKRIRCFKTTFLVPGLKGSYRSFKGSLSPIEFNFIFMGVKFTYRWAWSRIKRFKPIRDNFDSRAFESNDRCSEAAARKIWLPVWFLRQICQQRKEMLQLSSLNSSN